MNQTLERPILLSPITDAQCTVCHGAGEIYSSSSGKMVPCTNCGGSGQAATDPRDQAGTYACLGH